MLLANYTSIKKKKNRSEKDFRELVKYYVATNKNAGIYSSTKIYFCNILKFLKHL